MRRALGWAALGVVVAGAAGAVLWLAYGRTTKASATTSAAPATTTVRAGRRDIAETESFSGTLDYSDPRTVTAQTQGTLTAVAPAGSLRKRGQVLYRVNNVPSVLMYGIVPAWRELRSGVDDGPDVRELEWNLVALGYDPDRDITIDDAWTSATTAAVERWQEALGVSQTGVVALGDVVFMPGARRVGEVIAAKGSAVQPGGQVLTATRTTQDVTVSVDATSQPLVAVGKKVTVDMPDGSTVPGKITAVGTVAAAPASDGTDTNADTTPTIEVTVALLRPTRERLDQAPVDVDLTTESRQNVVTVPVTALVALLGGGYGVETPNPAGGTTLVAVAPGLYGDGYVEITRGLKAGDRVVVPQEQ